MLWCVYKRMLVKVKLIQKMPKLPTWSQCLLQFSKLTKQRRTLVDNDNNNDLQLLLSAQLSIIPNFKPSL